MRSAGRAGERGDATALLAWRRAPFCLAVLLIATASALVAVPGRAAAQSATCPTAISAGTVPAPGTVGDPWRPTQWSLDQLDFEAQWPRTTGAGVKVAVIDTAPTMSHEDLAGHYTDGCSVIADPDARIRWDNPGAYALSPAQGHGVLVASVLAATPGNGLGISGAAPGVSIIPVDITGSSLVFNAAILGPAIRWAVDAGADIVNLSLVTPGDVAAVRSAVEYAETRGVLVVAAVGNNANTGSPINYPAGYSTVLGVGATTEARTRYARSSVNSSVSVVAPGSWLPGASGEAADAYVSAVGTSAATPHVSALAARCCSSTRASALPRCAASSRTPPRTSAPPATTPSSATGSSTPAPPSPSWTSCGRPSPWCRASPPSPATGRPR